MSSSSSHEKLTLHWLSDSRAHRVLWLLEILALDYELKIYLRDPNTFRGPASLYEVHPLGKSPLLEVKFCNEAEPLILAETGHIIQFLLNNYDKNGILVPDDPKKQILMDYYLHYAEGTLQPLNIALLVNSSVKTVAPFGLKKLGGIIARGINNSYYYPEWKLNMSFLEKQLIKEGQGFFVGDRLSAADVMLSFPIFENLFDNPHQLKEFFGPKFDIFKSYPNLAAWSSRIKENPTYIRINEIIEEKMEVDK